jgi:hypothetical protein
MMIKEQPVGKCKAKGWVWRKASIQAIVFPKTEDIGTSRCVVQSKGGFSKEDLDHASQMHGFVREASSGFTLSFYIPGTGEKKQDIAHYDRLKADIMKLINADYAVIAAKKAVSQITVYKCGSR